jgi:uncharacterized protein
MSSIETYPIPIDLEAIKAYCQKYGIREFALFGSVLRDDFDTESDVDVLVEYEPEVRLDFDLLFKMEDELSLMFGRKVDLVEKSRIKNPFRRASILGSYRVIYAA